MFKTSTSDSTNNVQWCSASLRNSRAADPEIFHFFSSMRSSRSFTLQRFNEKCRGRVKTDDQSQDFKEIINVRAPDSSEN